MLIDCSGHPEDGGERAGEPLPVLALLVEVASPGRGHRIHLRLAPARRLAPLGVDQPLFLESIQRWVERTGVHGEHLARGGLYADCLLYTVCLLYTSDA